MHGSSLDKAPNTRVVLIQRFVRDNDLTQW